MIVSLGVKILKHVDFTPIDDYTGDMILIDRLSEFYPVNSWSWNDGEVIELDDIACAIHEGQPEESEPFGDNWKHVCWESKPTEWHIGRILYFIKNPDEIRDIEIDNICNGKYICPIPVIVDGNHRFMAAMWLHDQGKMEKVHCMYGGRTDLLDYLTGNTEEQPLE